ncbi:glycosyltransferase [Granulicella sp. dw_53]|uniref:glycosyltransferase n=1 Tax=Granulicella sp. dw_53 TaxID=2719792 RepID=UPI001BD20623|nr:glycosyltransferase [Granulicella sp. dw_53]
MKIGFISMPLSGHLNPMTTLARKLASRGHDVVFIGIPDVEPTVRAADLQFVPFCEKEYPFGCDSWSGVTKRQGLDVVQYSSREVQPGLCRTALEYLPGILAETGIEALVFDTVYFYLELVPMHLGIPYVHIWNVLHFDLSGETPPTFFSWPHETTPEAVTRNLEGAKWIGENIAAPILAAAIPYAEKMELQIDWEDPASTMSKLAIITQTPREFDLPGVQWPDQFIYAGPFHDDAGREQVSFPWRKLTGEPLIYASLGTLVNGLDYLYKIILEAVGKLSGIQTVLSVGRNISPADLGPIPSNVIVVRKAPQIELLKLATLCLTHAGLNTALESLAQGVPMVALPIAFDQPGVATRIAYHGVGEFFEIQDLTADSLSELIQTVLKNPSYADRARYFQRVIAKTRGLDLAADVIETAFGLDQATDLTQQDNELLYA